jgi:hypothetical protein
MQLGFAGPGMKGDLRDDHVSSSVRSIGNVG